MTDIRQGLGLMCVAAICFLIGLALGGDEGSTGDVMQELSLLPAVIGLGAVAWGLMRRTD